MAHSVDSQATSPGAALRAELDGLERLAVKPSRASVEELLLKLDEVQAALERLEEGNTDVRAERVRWENVTRRLESRPGLIAGPAVAAGGLPALRRKHGRETNPQRGAWWDADITRRRRIRRVITETTAILAGIAALVLVAWWIFVTFFPPDPVAVALLNATTAIERQVDAGDWPAALAEAETSFATNPGQPELALWVAVLAEITGDSARAEEMRTRALELLQGDRVGFYLVLSNHQARAAQGEAAVKSAEAALALEPENPEVTFALGRAAFIVGDRERALEYLDKTYTLAIESNPQLALNARVLYGDMMRMPDLSTLESTLATTPEAAPEAAPTSTP